MVEKKEEISSEKEIEQVKDEGKILTDNIENKKAPIKPIELKFEDESKGKSNFRKFIESNRKVIAISLALAVVFIGVIISVVYYFLFSNSFFTVKVEDKRTGKILSGVEVQIGELSQKTDNFGKARFDSLKPGSHSIKVIVEGYSEVKEPVTLKRGNNGEFTVSLDLILINISGKVRDYVNKTNIEGVKATLKEVSVETDKEGSFQFKEVLPGTQRIKIEKDGYVTKDLEISGLSDTELADIYLTPSAQVIFVSNRDGEKAIYKGYFDGQDIKKLWENKKGFDDYFAVLSPNHNYVTFYSNREGEKEKNGEYKNKLYLNSVDGLNLKKITDDDGEIAWLDDSGGFVISHTSYDDNSQPSSTIKSYDVAKQELKDLFKDSDFESKNVTSSASMTDLKVAADNRLIFRVANWSDSSKAGMYKSDKDGKNLKKLTEKNPYSYTLTPDKTKVQFMYYQNANPERYEIDIATGKETQIPLEPRKGQSVGQGYFDYEEKELISANLKAYIDYRDGKNDLYITDLQGNNERRLSVIGGIVSFEFASSGKYIVFYVSKEQKKALYVVGLAEGNQPIKITDCEEFVGVI